MAGDDAKTLEAATESAPGAENSAEEVVVKCAPKPPLRLEYEERVRGIRTTVEEMREEGKSSEEIARWAHAERRAIGVQYKDLSPADYRENVIYPRNLQKYGDKLGPSIDYLRGKGKSWDDIIESACRPGGADLFG